MKGKKGTKHLKVGALGERIACEYLESRGFVCLEMNHHSRYGEIDLIMEKNTRVHFVEVKARKQNTQSSMHPKDNLTHRKLTRFARAVEHYVNTHDVHSYQMDAVTVVIDEENRRAEVEYFEHISPHWV